MDTLVMMKKVRRSFGDNTGIFVKDEDLLMWANEAQLAIVRETGCLTAEATVAASATPWTLPDTFIKTIRVLYGVSPISFAPVEHLDSLKLDLTYPGSPGYFYFINGQLRLYPDPASTDTTTVTIQYSKTPNELTDPADLLTIPLIYHEDVVRFVLARCHERNENYKGYEVAMGEFLGGGAGRTDESDVQDETYVLIRDDPADFETWGYV